MEMIEQGRREMLEHLWDLVSDPTVPREYLEAIALERVDNMSRLLFEAFDTHYVGLVSWLFYKIGLISFCRSF